jgi:hypothetical protein
MAVGIGEGVVGGESRNSTAEDVGLRVHSWETRSFIGMHSVLRPSLSLGLGLSLSHW